MNCKNCGTPLMGMEHACPVCGAPLPTNQPNPMSQPVADPAMMNQMAMPQQMASQPPQMMPGGAMPMGLPTATETPQPEPKKGNNAIAILMLLVAFAAIGVGVFLALTEEEEPAKPSKTTPSETETSTSDEPEPSEAVNNTLNFSGYSFTLPEGYTGLVDDEVGVTIQGEEVMYTILIDYTAGYDYYKQAFQNQTAAPTALGNVEAKEYFCAGLVDPTGANAWEYMTTAESGSTFVGLIIKKEFAVPTMDDLTPLNEILASAEKQYDVVPGDEEDAGKVGIVNYIPTFNKDNFSF